MSYKTVRRSGLFSVAASQRSCLAIDTLSPTVASNTMRDFPGPVVIRAWFDFRGRVGQHPPEPVSPMRFVLIDRILELQPGRSLVAVKNLSLGEEYLADHFPGFPVMPGVLMLEALTQAGAWLIRATEDFAHSIVLLKQARTIKYGSFVEPGRQLRLQVEIVEHGPRDTMLKGKGIIDDQVMVQGRIILTRHNLRERDPELHATDTAIVSGLRDLYETLRKGSVGARAMLRDDAVEPSLESPRVLASGSGRPD